MKLRKKLKRYCYESKPMPNRKYGYSQRDNEGNNLYIKEFKTQSDNEYLLTIEPKTWVLGYDDMLTGVVFLLAELSIYPFFDYDESGFPVFQEKPIFQSEVHKKVYGDKVSNLVRGSLGHYDWVRKNWTGCPKWKGDIKKEQHVSDLEDILNNINFRT